MNITVFGGSQPKEGNASYAEAYELGSLLARAGHTVLTGGYIGTMEAVSRGAAEAGGHVIGVTCADIEAWRPVRPNAWVQEQRRFATLQERLNELVLACDAAIALPGGPGTLTEIALTWNLMIVHSM
ncbi:MAG: LOG family protein, partial [Anaerolineales bacterium]|nr:LOG family protein [Anaerolineales bacterium]